MLNRRVYPIALVLFGLGFALVPLSRGNLFFYWDNAQQHVAQTAFLQRGLQSGVIPQWWPDVGLGFPATAEGQAAHYHPIRLLCAVLFSPAAALMWEVALYFAIAGLSTYFLLRALRLHPAACFLGGACQMFCGFAIVYVRNIALHRSFCLVPLGILCAERFVRQGSVRSWLAATLVIGVQFLAGHPSLAIVTLVATTLYVALRSVDRSWRRDTPLPVAAKALFHVVTAWVIAGTVGFGLAAVQVIPTLLHVQESVRQGGLTFESAVDVLPATVRGLGQLLLPYAYLQGDWLPTPAFWGSFNPVPTAGMYSGMACAVLAPIALWWRRRWPDATITLAVSFAIALGFAFGPRAPFFPALWSLPGMNGVRFPSRFLLWAALCLSCLAALGLQRLIGVSRLRFRTSRKLAPIGLVTGAFLVAAMAFLMRQPQAQDGVALSMGWFAAAALTASLVTLTKGRAQANVLVGAAALAIADLLFFRAHSNYAPAMSIDAALTPPSHVEFFKRDRSGPFRTLALIPTEKGAFTLEELRDFVQADASALWGVDSADVYLSLFLKRHFAVRSSIVQELLHRPESAASLASFLGALNVKYIIAPKAISLSGWERVQEAGQTAVWKNPVTLPRAFLVGRTVPQQFALNEEWRVRSNQRLEDYRGSVSDWMSRAVDAQILDHVMAQRIDYAAVSEVLDGEAIDVNGIESDASVQSEAAPLDEMRFVVETRRPAFLAISNSSYPGWQATINGQASSIFQTNWVTMGVAVPAGKSEVVLRYRTPGYAAGFAVSTGVLLLVALMLLRPSLLVRVLPQRR